jgi:hypothetical protein
MEWRPPELHDAATQFCKEHAGHVDLALIQRAWLAIDPSGAITGVLGIQQRLDASLFHAIGEGTARALLKRLNGFCADTGLRGQRIFLDPGTGDQRNATLRALEKASPEPGEAADRWLAKII